MQAFEVTGTIDPSGKLTLDQPLQVSHATRVRVIVLLSESEQVSSSPDSDELSESQEFSAASLLSIVDEIREQVPDEAWKTALSSHSDIF